MKALLKNNEGIALPIVVSIIAVITLLGFTAFFVVDSQTTMGAHYEKSETALSIAEAGVNEYLWHLNRDPQFYETEEGRKYVKDSDGNPKVHDVQNGQYTLKIEPPSDSQRVIKIKATGWLKSDKTVKAAIEVDVRKRGFLQNLYLSHIEELSNGEKIWWTSGDELFGPLHTNGDLNIDGNPVFHDRVTYTKNKNIRSE